MDASEGDAAGLAEALEAATATVRDAKYGFLATVSDVGRGGGGGIGTAQPRGRVVEVRFEDGLGRLWICSNDATRKVAQVRAHDRVAVLVWHQESLGFVELVGRARMMDGSDALAKWPGDDWLLFYPNGPQSPRFCCIEVTVERVEVVSLGHGVGLGDDPKDWHPPVALVRTATGAWALQPPKAEVLERLRGGE